MLLDAPECLRFAKSGARHQDPLGTLDHLSRFKGFPYITKLFRNLLKLLESGKGNFNRRTKLRLAEGLDQVTNYPCLRRPLYKIRFAVGGQEEYRCDTL